VDAPLGTAALDKTPSDVVTSAYTQSHNNNNNSNQISSVQFSF